MMGATQEPGGLTRDSARPLYQQIKDAILVEIRSGKRTPGDRMSSENELVGKLGVSRMTVNRALRELTQEGYLERVHGVGTFVAEKVRHASLIELKNVADEVREQGKTHHAKILVLKAEKARGVSATRLNLKPGTRIFHITLVHYSDDVPIQLEDRYVNPAVVPAFLDGNFEEMTPTQYLVGLFRPDEMEHIVQAILPNRETCQLLDITRTEPCLRLLRRTWKGGQVVTAVSLLYAGSRYDLAARYATDSYRKNTP